MEWSMVPDYISDRCRLLHAQCGNGDWRRDYVQLHRDILAGRSAPRYLLASGENGAQLRLTQERARTKEPIAYSAHH